MDISIKITMEVLDGSKEIVSSALFIPVIEGEKLGLMSATETLFLTLMDKFKKYNDERDAENG